MTSSFDKDAALDRLSSGEKTPEHLQIAIVLTLLEAAHAAGEVGGEELIRVSSRMSSVFGLSDAEIGHQIEIAQVIRLDETRKARFFTDIAKNFTLVQRQQILSFVWRILIIDGKVCSDEAVTAVEIRKALGLSLEAAVAARIRAENDELELIMKSLKGTEEEEGAEDEEQ